MRLTTGKKKAKYVFQTKKDFITCTTLAINEFLRCHTRSDNVYFVSNGQTLLAAFTAAFCFARVDHNFIKL